VLPLGPETVELLREHLALRLPYVPAFNVPDATHTSRLLQRDL